METDLAVTLCPGYTGGIERSSSAVEGAGTAPAFAVAQTSQPAATDPATQVETVVVTKIVTIASTTEFTIEKGSVSAWIHTWPAMETSEWD